MKRPKEAVLEFLRVKPQEAERVGLMLLLSVVSVGGVVIAGQTAGRSLLLSGLPADLIPLRFILSPLLLVAVSAVYARSLAASDRLGPVVQRTFLALTVAVILSRAILPGLISSPAFLLGVYSLLEMAGALSMTLFWTIASNLFDARAARRVFGLISGGSTIANIAFGLFLAGLARRVPAENILWVVVVSLFLCIAIVRRLERKYRIDPEDAPKTAASRSEGFVQETRAVLSSRLVLMLAAIAVVISVASNMADYQLDLALKREYGSNGPAIAEFLSLMRVVAGVGGFIVQFFMASVIMEKFGVKTALCILPGFVSVGAALSVVTGGSLFAVSIPRVADQVLKFTLNDSALNLFFIPLSPDLRSRAKALIDGIIRPPLAALLGVGFFIAARFGVGGVTMWGVPLLGFAILWLVLVLRTERHYIEALSHSIAMRRLDPSDHIEGLDDDTSRGVMARVLNDDDPARVAHALSLLLTSESDWSDDVARVLTRKEPEVRRAALEYLAARPSPKSLPLVEGCLDDADPLVRQAAITALGRIQGPKAVPRLAPKLSDTDLGVRATTIATMVQSGGLAGFLRAGRSLNALFESENPMEKREGARVLGILGVASFYDPLVDLLGDKDEGVRRAAIAAAARCATPELVPALSGLLKEPSLRVDALRAMQLCGGADPFLLSCFVLDQAADQELRCAAAISLATLGAPALPTLIQASQDANHALRGAALVALINVRSKNPGLDVDRTLAPRLLEAEIKVAYRNEAALDDIRREAPHEHLLIEVFERLHHSDCERLLDVLDLSHEGFQADAVRQALAQGDARAKAGALELVDNVAGNARTLLSPFFGDNDRLLHEARARLGVFSRPLTAHLEELSSSQSAYERACAALAVGRFRLREFEPFLAESANADDALLATAARKALSLLRQPEVSMPLTPLEQVLFLKEVPLFREVPGEDVATLLPIVEQATFTDGEVLIRQGEQGDSLFIIVEGRVHVSVDGRPIEKHMGSKDVIGELSLLSGEPRSATCTALSDVLALKIKRRPFWDLMRERPAVTLGVVQILLDYLKRARNPPAPAQAAPPA